MIRKTPYYKSLKSTYDLSSPKDISGLLRYAIDYVPFYSENYKHLANSKDLAIGDFSVLEKSEISGQEKRFVSSRKLKWSLFKYSTGGTTNISLNLFSDLRFKIFVLFARDFVLSRMGGVDYLRVAILRGGKPKKGIYEYVNGELVLSSYDISVDTVSLYAEVISRYDIDWIHAYPSSITIFCRCIRALGDKVDLSKIKGIVTSSETITKEEKLLILEVFPHAMLIDFYGLNEEAAIAYSINIDSYKFLDGYGHVELLDSGESTPNGKLCEIVATSCQNWTMPLIRYKTGDYAEVDAEGNVLAIVGRSQDKIVNGVSALVPCVVLTRPGSLLNVQGFQYVQKEVGKLEFHVIPTNNFTERDVVEITKDIEVAFGGQVLPLVKVVSKLIRLPNGKQPRLIQHLDINLF